MMSFDAVFNCIFLGIFVYHVIYFLVQYFVFKRVELFYYSMFLFSASVYYFVFIASPILNVAFHPSWQSIFSAFQMSFSFIQIYFYVLFIISYLSLTKRNWRVYNFFRFYKYYNLVFIFVFLLLSIFNVESTNFFGILSLLALPLLLTVLYLLRKMYTTYANIVVFGTAFNILGTLISFSLINYEVYTHTKLSFNDHVPAQIGLLLDLFVLGYGLSLKAAESDKKLVKYLLENQQLVETERSRLARDLHDGLGGMLSGIKLNLSSMKGNVVVHEKDATLFSKSIKQLDNAIAEMRRVAHNMMPEALLKFGLTEAVQDYCDGINESKTIKIKFTSLGVLQPIQKSTEVILYRIIQELTNNTIKHALAKNILVQLSKNENILTLTIEDDGKGFDTKQIENIKGAGLQNVQSRVDYLKGSFTIESEMGKGASINIEIPI